jgi:hypothetical protein
MNDSISIQLKILVERAVRPVRAGTGRKMQMREELLAHATSVFEEELARQSDAQAALRATAQRFGDPGALAAQLQGSVPRRSILYSYLEAWWGFSPELWTIVETTAGAFRLATRAGIAASAGMLLAYLPLLLMKEEIARLGVGLPLSIAAASGLYIFALMLFGLWLQQAVSQRSWLQAAAIVVISALIPPEITFMLCAIASWDVAWSFDIATAQLLPSLLLMPVAVICLAIAIDREIRVQQEWAGLVID